MATAPIPDRAPATPASPNHHLYRNGRLWWLAATILVGRETKRIRRSLGTRNIDEARARRDAQLNRLGSEAGVTVKLRFRPARPGNRSRRRRVASC